VFNCAFTSSRTESVANTYIERENERGRERERGREIKWLE